MGFVFRLWAVVSCGFLFSFSAHSQKLVSKAPVQAFERTVQMNFGGADNPGEEANFNRITDEITALYVPFAQNYGATLIANKYWSSNVVNAFASRQGNNWIISMYGGLYRHPAITEDSFALVTCHEIAHHFAGFPFKGPFWASAEGNSDYYAAVSCLKSYFTSNSAELFKNLQFADLQTHANYPFGDQPWYYCGRVYGFDQENAAKRGLCIRIIHAGREFAELNHLIVNDIAPDYGNWNAYPAAQSTLTYHPPSQCRLNTMFAGGLCKVNTSLSSMTIPGHGAWSTITQKEGQRVAAGVGCSRSLVDVGFPHHNWQENHQIPMGYRPDCWFKHEAHHGVDF